jgi:hypothetical protein
VFKGFFLALDHLKAVHGDEHANLLKANRWQ